MNNKEQAAHLIANNLIDLDGAVEELLDLRDFRVTVAAALEKLRHHFIYDYRPAHTPDTMIAMFDEAIAALGLGGTEKCFDCGASQVADTCPECGKSFCAVCVEKDESCCDKEEVK